MADWDSMKMISGERGQLMGRVKWHKYFSHRAILGSSTNKGLILDETHHCSEIVTHIWQYLPAPALLLHKICYIAAKIAHLQATFLRGRKLDMRHIFNVYFGRMVFSLALSLLLLTVEHPPYTPCSLTLLLIYIPPNHGIDFVVYFIFWAIS